MGYQISIELNYVSVLAQEDLGVSVAKGNHRMNVVRVSRR